jgi:hypothetical protein
MFPAADSVGLFVVLFLNVVACGVVPDNLVLLRTNARGRRSGKAPSAEARVNRADLRTTALRRPRFFMARKNFHTQSGN